MKLMHVIHAVASFNVRYTGVRGVHGSGEALHGNLVSCSVTAICVEAVMACGQGAMFCSTGSFTKSCSRVVQWLHSNTSVSTQKRTEIKAMILLILGSQNANLKDSKIGGTGKSLSCKAMCSMF